MAESGDHAAPSDSSSHSGQQSSNAESTPEDYLQGIDAAKQGCHREAVAAFRRSVENNPDHAPSHANLGAALANMGEYAEAVDTLESAVRRVQQPACK